jgi:hypothetical protein
MAALVLGWAAWPSGAGASGDVGCAPEWKLVAPTLSCASRIVIGPGSDTRVNLLLLLRDRAGLDGRGLAYPQPEWLASYYGHVFTDWDVLSDALYPSPGAEPDASSEAEAEQRPFQGSRCQSVKTGGAQFLAAVDRNRRIGVADRARLAEWRDVVLAACRVKSGDRDEGALRLLERGAPPESFTSPEAREFATYVMGAAAFYLEEWPAAREAFSTARNSRDEWLRETSLYMAARSELNAAIASGMDEWGEFESDKADKALGEGAERAFAAYFAAYPQGRYAPSATGLVRRAQWVAGAVGKQGATYGRLLAAADPKDAAAAELIAEIDDKYLFEDGAEKAGEGPWLLAVHDLLRMRSTPDEDAYLAYDSHGFPALTAAELSGQEAAFAGQPELYAFLKANFAFYVDHDYRAVLQLIPDDARKPEYTPLQFSRQMLRGMALAELGDRNEAGFWQELLGGAKGLHQRPTVELGLALSWERSGQVEKVFAAGSPIEDTRIRAILLNFSAGPDLLRTMAKASDRPALERDIAAFVLLYKELSRASYAAVVEDLSLVRADASTEGGLYDDLSQQEQVPTGLFTKGNFSEDYGCPALRQTAATLARTPRDVKGRLCLGEFYRLNGFDYLDLDGAREKGELGSFAAYPGTPIDRARIYSDLIGEAGVSHEDRAYALYRAVYCYAPSGYSSCGGEEVPESQRKAWFQRLKGEFKDTRWGREIEYYW